MKEKIKKIKRWIAENPNKVVIFILSIVGLGLITKASMVSKDKNQYLEQVKSHDYEPFDPGKDLDMKFVDPETNEVLGTIKVSESYMNDMMDIVSDDGTEKA